MTPESKGTLLSMALYSFPVRQALERIKQLEAAVERLTEQTRQKDIQEYTDLLDGNAKLRQALENVLSRWSQGNPHGDWHFKALAMKQDAEAALRQEGSK